MNIKSKSKNIFASSTKYIVDPLIKRHKSQESYSDTKVIFNDKNLKSARTNKITSSSKKEASSTNTNSASKYKINGINNEKKVPLIKTPIGRIFDKKDDCVRQIESDNNLVNNTIGSGINKIILKNNDTRNEEEICIGGDEECDLDEIEEMRSSQINNDFYTNSIGEASISILEKGQCLINNLPKPFVKQSGSGNKFLISNINKDNGTRRRDTSGKKLNIIKEEEDKIKQKIEHYYRRLLAYAKKGDRDGFLETLSKIYKIQGNKTNINFKDESGWSSIHFAADEGNLKIVEILVKMNIDVNMKTQNKKTPLHLAAEKGYFDISRILIENGAPISTLDDEKNNPIHICSFRGHLELLKYLLEKYPQADTKNIYGKSPLELAKNDKIKDLLKEYYAKNTYQYHKITIHDISSNKKTQVNTEKENKLNVLKTINNHNKFQSNDYNSKEGNNSAGRNNISTGVNLNSIGNINLTATLNSNSNKLKKISNIQAVNIKSVKDIISNCNSSSGKSTTTFNSGVSINRGQLLYNRNITVKREENDDMKNAEDESDETVNPFSSIEEERLGPSCFICHALLGKGSFGEVYLVEKKNTKTLYAMKVLSKDKIMAQNLVKYAMTERNVLSITDHPFIVKLSYAFQSENKLFLILEYCPGGDLAEHLIRERRFSEERAKIYLCEIILALEDLHKRDIIFRDLKPDNVVLDRQGHALLTDFGLSKEGVLDNKGAKSFCGSIAYLAPEMLKRSGHGKSVDWYLLGVLFYEMLVGVPPYFTSNK
jgi:ankyrin repeat protein